MLPSNVAQNVDERKWNWFDDANYGARSDWRHFQFLCFVSSWIISDVCIHDATHNVRSSFSRTLVMQWNRRRKKNANCFLPRSCCSSSWPQEVRLKAKRLTCCTTDRSSSCRCFQGTVNKTSQVYLLAPYDSDTIQWQHVNIVTCFTSSYSWAFLQIDTFKLSSRVAHKNELWSIFTSVRSHLKAFHSSLSNGFSIKRGKRKDADLILSRAQRGESKGFFRSGNLSSSLKTSQFHL